MKQQIVMLLGLVAVFVATLASVAWSREVQRSLARAPSGQVAGSGQAPRQAGVQILVNP